jgi:hypothetical protein
MVTGACERGHKYPHGRPHVTYAIFLYVYIYTYIYITPNLDAKMVTFETPWFGKIRGNLKRFEFEIWTEVRVCTVDTL